MRYICCVCLFLVLAMQCLGKRLPWSRDHVRYPQRLPSSASTKKCFPLILVVSLRFFACLVGGSVSVEWHWEFVREEYLPRRATRDDYR